MWQWLVHSIDRIVAIDIHCSEYVGQMPELQIQVDPVLFDQDIIDVMPLNRGKDEIINHSGRTEVGGIIESLKRLWDLFDG